MYLQYENDLDKSKQMIKSFEKYISDDEIKNEVINNVFGNKIKALTNSEKKRNIQKTSINRIIKLLNNNKHEMQ